MFETLLAAEARRKASRPRDVAAAALAGALFAVGAYGLARSSGGEPARVAAAERRPSAPAAAPGREPRQAVGDARAGGRNGSADAVARGRAAQAAGAAGHATAVSEPARAGGSGATAGGASSGRARSGAGALPNERGADGRGAGARAARAGAEGAAAARTELALEPVGDAGAVTVERTPAAAADGTPPRGTTRPDAGAAGTPPAGAVPDGARSAVGAEEAPGDTWRVTARTPGPHRLRLVAAELRDSAGRVDTVARRALGAVEIVVAAGDGAAGAPTTAWRRAAASPLAWLLACAASFVAGSLHGRRRQGARDDPPDDDPDVGRNVGPDGRVPFGGG